VSAHTRHSETIAIQIGVSIHNKKKAGNKMRIALENTDHQAIEELALSVSDVYIVSRDAPVYLGGSMVTMFVTILEDSFGNTKFGVLPKTYEILHAVNADDKIVWFGQCEDQTQLMGEAVNIALAINDYGDRNVRMRVVTESGTHESHMYSIYEYMAERGFPF
jgi:hypothetical protein